MQKTQVLTALGEREYLFSVPTAIPSDRVLVHNVRAWPRRRLGSWGFRAWLDVPGRLPLERCACGWASELGPHYRVVRKAA